jgi:hypothetical protein
MSDSKTASDLLKTIEDKSQQVAIWQKELTALGKAYNVLTGIPVESIMKKVRNGNNINLTIAEAVEQLLRNEGNPLYLNQIYERLQEDYGMCSSKQVILSTLVRYISAGKKFVRTAPRQYGLLEWEVEPHVACN